MPKTFAIIPARLESSRLPNKLLLAETGKPLINYAVEAAVDSGIFDQVVVASDSEQILNAIDSNFLGKVRPLMVKDHCKCGTSRAAIAVSQMRIDTPISDHDVVVNIQGDEALLDDDIIRRVVAGIIPNLRPTHIPGGADVSTVATLTVASCVGPSVVKVVTDNRDRALYFSRAAIPSGAYHTYCHHGVYGFMVHSLLKIGELIERSDSLLADSERLEQLHWLQHGYVTYVAKRNGIFHGGINTRSEYDDFARICNERDRQKAKP